MNRKTFGGVFITSNYTSTNCLLLKFSVHGDSIKCFLHIIDRRMKEGWKALHHRNVFLLASWNQRGKKKKLHSCYWSDNSAGLYRGSDKSLARPRRTQATFPEFYGTWRFTTTFTRVHHLYLLHTITIRIFVVPTRSVRYMIPFRETGVVHQITYSFNYCLFTYGLLIHFILDIK